MQADLPAVPFQSFRVLWGLFKVVLVMKPRLELLRSLPRSQGIAAMTSTGTGSGCK